MWFSATSLGVTPKRCRRVAPSAARGHRVLGSLPFRSSSAPGRCQSGGTTKLPHVFLYGLKSIVINKKKMDQYAPIPMFDPVAFTASQVFWPPLDFGYKWSTCSRWSFGSSLEGDFSAEPYHSKQGHLNNHLSRLDSLPHPQHHNARQKLNIKGFQVAIGGPLFFSIQRQLQQQVTAVRSLQLTCFKIEEVMGISRPSLRSHLHKGDMFVFITKSHYYCYCSGSGNYYWHHHYHDWYEHHFTFNIAYNII